MNVIRGEFLPIVSLDHSILLSYLRSLKIVPSNQEPDKNSTILTTILDILRYEANKLDGPTFTWTIIAIAVLILVQRTVRLGGTH